MEEFNRGNCFYIDEDYNEAVEVNFVVDFLL
jgi:hypothetical protein